MIALRTCECPTQLCDADEWWVTAHFWMLSSNGSRVSVKPYQPHSVSPALWCRLQSIQMPWNELNAALMGMCRLQPFSHIQINCLLALADSVLNALETHRSRASYMECQLIIFAIFCSVLQKIGHCKMEMHSVWNEWQFRFCIQLCRRRFDFPFIRCALFIYPESRTINRSACRQWNSWMKITALISLVASHLHVIIIYDDYLPTHYVDWCSLPSTSTRSTNLLDGLYVKWVNTRGKCNSISKLKSM